MLDIKNKIKITKLDAAKRQLITAIKLYFNEKDPVAIHTLTCASHEILSNIGEKMGLPPFALSSKSIAVKETARHLWKDAICQAKNFFKHADRDPDDVLDFNPKLNEYYLLDACEGYQIITDEKVIEFIIFRAWFHFHHPQIMKILTDKIIENPYGENKLLFFTEYLKIFNEIY